jgi:hypothetical protein
MPNGTQDPYKMVDPNGLQSGGTGSAALGFVALAASGTGTTVAKALGLGSSTAKVLAAGISLSALGQMSLFGVGLVLVAVGILLNIMSLFVRWQRARDLAVYMDKLEYDYKNRRREETTASPPQAS